MVCCWYVCLKKEVQQKETCGEKARRTKKLFKEKIAKLKQMEEDKERRKVRKGELGRKNLKQNIEE